MRSIYIFLYDFTIGNLMISFRNTRHNCFGTTTTTKKKQIIHFYSFNSIVGRYNWEKKEYRSSENQFYWWFIDNFVIFNKFNLFWRKEKKNTIIRVHRWVIRIWWNKIKIRIKNQLNKSWYQIKWITTMNKMK